MKSQFLFFCKLVSVVGAVAISPAAYAVNDWTWLGGDATLNAAGIYPESPGLPGKPGGRVQAAQWTDNAGNLWMFGGRGIPSGGTFATALADLWKFDPLNQVWTWVGGSKNFGASPTYPASYGQPGVPGPRYGAATWKDTAGNFWMFGGLGFNGTDSGYLNDLWKYNPQTNVWTYEAGVSTLADPGNYSAGVGNTGRPAARYQAAAGTTNNGDFLLFGGAVTNGKLNDMWRFSPSNPTIWRWVGGSSAVNATGTQPPLHGSSGWPGSRSDMGFFTDERGHFWIFGGFGYGSSIGQRNDLWTFNPDNNIFIFMNGTHSSQNTIYPAEYGQIGTMGCRNQMLYWYVDGKLWISGGYGQFTTGFVRGSDLWSYTLTDGQWRWIDGPKGDSAGVFPVAVGGTGLPAGRQGGICWTRNNYQIYLFGGATDGSNVSWDFWRRNVSTNSDVGDWQLY